MPPAQPKNPLRALSDEERAYLERLSRASSAPAEAVMRAKLLLAGQATVRRHGRWGGAGEAVQRGGCGGTHAAAVGIGYEFLSFDRFSLPRKGKRSCFFKGLALWAAPMGRTLG
jgi:hypothetical protein